MDTTQDFPGGLGEIYSGWAGSELDLVPGERFWTRIEHIATKGEITRGFDAAMQGHSSPRIWLFLHEPGRGDLSAAVAMSFARELAFRDQAVLLLDCDDRDQALTRWAGRIEKEGWIDLARYGTSVLTSGVAMPFVGRRGYFLGVGSFAPTDVTSEEINTLLTRLRRQGDDVLLVAPSDFAGLMWAPAAAIRIFCWDQQTMPANEAAVINAGFTESGCPLTAVVSFRGTGPAEDLLVEQVLTEIPDGSAPPITAESDAPADPVVSGTVPATEPPLVSAGGKTESTSETDPSDLSPKKAAEVPDLDPDVADLVEAWQESESSPTRETSRVFWFGALAAVVLIALITAYYFKVVRVPSAGPFGQAEVATQTIPAQVGSGMEPADEGIPDDGAIGTVAVDSVEAQSDEQGQPEATPELTAGGEDAAVDSVITETVVEPKNDSQDDVPPALAVPVPTGFDMGPYRETVGAKGWALHVYSLPDSAATAKQVRELSRRGFQSTARIFDLGAKGTWNRIYVGSFATRTQAKQAMPALLKKLREKWAKPQKF